MDIILEGFDTYLFDRLYATLLPAQFPNHGLSGTSANATFSSVHEVPTSYASSTYQYQPASQYLSFQPTQYAYMSRWSRGDWWRQALSLYLITWYAPGSPISPSQAPLGLRTQPITPAVLYQEANAFTKALRPDGLLYLRVPLLRLCL